ncbi:GapR family DNA-binding domain-containing protein [Bradyrhizobium elkanii]|uniref:GapR family DNA-binding domain-containing protein n=1 Tax=Bradyrhizobium elkanii TaxID=29448 RepID=UPI0004B96F3E|nr:GapR family DNA-binding domain-containing protein [Bradyrhizobium elkanii]
MAKPAAAQTNDFDPEVVQEMLGKIDGYHADLASERGSSMARCRSIRESISNTYKEAKARGIPTKELRSLVKIRINEAKNREIYEELEQDQQHILSMLATAEGVKDLPLWRAAAMTAMGEAARATAH